MPNHQTTMSQYKKVSTLLTIACVLYMCMVSLFHTGLQVNNLQNRANDDHVLSPGEKPDLQEEISNCTSEENSHKRNLSGLRKTHQSKILQHLLFDKYDQENLAPQQISTSITMKKNNITSLRKELEEYQYLSLQKFKEKTMQKATVPSQEHKTFPDTTTSKVKQLKVNFLPLGDSYVYGAFLDNRYSDNQYVRIFVLQPTFKQDRQLLCRFHNNQNRSITVQAEPYDMCENHGRKYGGWIYSCQVTKTEDVDPQIVSLLLIANNRKVFYTVTSIPLQSLTTAGSSKPPHRLDNQPFDVNNVKNQPQTQLKLSEANDTQEMPGMKLGVCVPPLYGNSSLSKVVNFIEMCRLLGADNIFLYIHDIPNDSLSFLQNYTSLAPEVLTLMAWDLPIAHKKTPASETSQIIWNHGQLLAIQHCLYANMANFDWLLFIDIDEMLIPQTAETWQAMLSQVEARFHSQFPHKPLAGISFQSAFFQQDFQTQITNSISYFQYLHRTRQTSSQRFKMFVQPFWVFELGIHHLSKPISEEAGLVRAGLGDGLVHHYRKCVPDYDPSSNLQCEILVKDETILRYEVPLTISSREVLSAAMEFFIHN